MNLDKENANNLRTEFFKKFDKKYELKQKDPIGEGHYACVFKAYDIDRKIDVAIKIFFDGIAPEGSERGWHITSSVVHHQIAQTSTIESFYSRSLKKDCKAVVQRFIPGRSLKYIIGKLDSLERNESYQTVMNDFGLSYLKSLLTILCFCHNQKFGHGDCHDGNIIVFSEIHSTRNSFKAVLIDFDNSSIKETLSSKSEVDKIQDDIGLFRYFYRKTFYDWKYFDAVKIIFDSYDKMSEFQFSYAAVSEYIEFCIKKNSSKISIKKVLSKLPNPLSGFHFQPTINSIRKVAEIENVQGEFDEAFEEYKESIKSYDHWTYVLDVELIEGSVIKIYKDIFDN